jgi:hypothetical protein
VEEQKVEGGTWAAAAAPAEERGEEAHRTRSLGEVWRCSAVPCSWTQAEVAAAVVAVRLILVQIDGGSSSVA